MRRSGLTPMESWYRTINEVIDGFMEEDIRWARVYHLVLRSL